MRFSAAAAAACLTVIGFAAADDVKAAIRRTTDIPAQGLGPALQALAKERGFQIVYVAGEVNSLRTHGAKGELTSEEALKQILSETGLTYRIFGDDAVSIVPISSPAAADLTSSAAADHVSPIATDAPPSPVVEGPGSSTVLGASRPEGFSQRLRLAQADTSQMQTSTKGLEPGLEEVIVTAQKRTERLQDVPVPVTAIGAASLVENSQLKLEEYYNQIPGLTLTVGDGRGVPMISIRGITSGYTNPTVGVVMDGAPYGSSTNLALGALAPDIDPSELARVEVLRGPQGALYGASSMGGLLNYVTIDPSFDGVSGRLQAGTSSVYDGDELGYNLSAAVNVPLNDTFAIRANGFSRRDPGYIDNPVRNEEGVNTGEFEGGHVSALWRPSESFSLKLSALHQNSRTDGLARVDMLPGFDDLEQDVLIKSGWLEKEVTAYTANLTAMLGNVELTSVSGYNVNAFSDSIDLAPFSPLTEEMFGVTGTPLLDDIETKKVTQEIRLAIPLGQRFEWLLGGFYTDEDSDVGQDLLAQDAETGEVVGFWYDGLGVSTFTERAVFTNLTVHITDRFDMQFGGRQTRIKQTTGGSASGPLVGGGAVDDEPLDNTDDAFTYLLTPRFKITPDLMMYARLASGYRAGLPNGTLAAGAPPASKPDKTKNYELGVKGVVLDRTLSFDASLYHIDWTGIQMIVFDSLGIGYFTNGSEAKSQGVELSVESTPLPGLTLSGWVSWSAAELTEPFPAGASNVGVAGDRLPYSTRFSGNFSVQKEFPLASNLTGFIGGAVSYVGDRVGYFRAAPERQEYPSYTRTDLRAGLKYEAWMVNFFVNNATDERGVLAGGLDASPTYGFTHIVPRTLGLNASYAW
jgi:outer membrane receptor protein involved in Fe transport